MRDTIKFKTEINGKESEFEIYAEATMWERQQIENIVASFVGGHKELIKLKQVNEGFKEQLKEEKNKTIFGNPLDIFITSHCDDTVNRGYWFATFEILLVNPPIKVEDISTDDFDKMMSACGGALHRFQGQREKTKASQFNSRTPHNNKKGK